jgi:hypothetical protein
LNFLIVKGSVDCLLEEDDEKLCNFVYVFDGDLIVPIDRKFGNVLAVSFGHDLFERMELRKGTSQSFSQ